MADPRRHQRKRGVALPPGVVYVGRPTVWGNPFGGDREASVRQYREELEKALRGDASLLWEARGQLWELRGKDLACWCPLDLPCHADVLLELANREERGPRG